MLLRLPTMTMPAVVGWLEFGMPQKECVQQMDGPAVAGGKRFRRYFYVAVAAAMNNWMRNESIMSSLDGCLCLR